MISKPNRETKLACKLGLPVEQRWSGHRWRRSSAEAGCGWSSDKVAVEREEGRRRRGAWCEDVQFCCTILFFSLEIQCQCVCVCFDVVLKLIANMYMGLAFPRGVSTIISKPKPLTTYKYNKLKKLLFLLLSCPVSLILEISCPYFKRRSCQLSSFECA